MSRSRHLIRFATQAATIAALALPLLTGAASAQERDGNFLDNLFSRGEGGAQRQPQGQSQNQSEVVVKRSGNVAQADPGDVAVRLDSMENAIRQLTGTIEQLQFRNQQLEQQLRALQQGGAAAQPSVQPQQPGGRPSQSPNMPTYQPPVANPGRRGDVFDPNQQPNAPGTPRVLGNASIAAPEPAADNGLPIGAPGGRDAGAPLDLSTLSSNAAAPPPGSVVNNAPGQNLPPVMSQQNAPQTSPRVANAPSPQVATLPPTASPQDEYDMAYGYVLHKDYALAEQSFRDFLKKYPTDRLVPDAHYWLGESMFQRQRYRDAAESFLAVSTKYEKAGKAPDSLLRLGQSLAALNQKEAACATLAEVERKFPRASATVKRGVASEQKRVHC
jgi:tol-pal system protein YbgF